MTAASLRATFDTVYLLALTAWVGSVLFVSAVVGPLAFKVLGDQDGGRFVRALFPRYYAWGAICGALALPALVCGALCFEELRGPAVGAQAAFVLAGTLIMLYNGNVLTPAIQAARLAGPERRDRFERLHHRSVTLNSFVLLVGLGLLIAFANRPAPRTPGIDDRRAHQYQARYREVKRRSDEFWSRYAATVRRGRPRPDRDRSPAKARGRDAGPAVAEAGGPD